MAGEKLESILVVDDDHFVLTMVAKVLNAANFLVLQASSGATAIKLAANYAGRIDLLLSDVLMAGMSGPDLGEALKKTRPDMHVMLMSGFPGGDLLVLNYGWAFIDKPFVPKKLVEMVNSVLHTPDKSQGSRQFDTRKDPEQSGKPSEEKKSEEKKGEGANKLIETSDTSTGRARMMVSEYLENQARNIERVYGHNPDLAIRAHELREWATIAGLQEEELTRLRAAKTTAPFVPPPPPDGRPARSPNAAAISGTALAETATSKSRGEGMPQRGSEGER
jgi:DNA-binding response OmpR family regulator